MRNGLCCRKSDDLVCYKGDCKIEDLKNSMTNHPSISYLQNKSKISQSDGYFEGILQSETNLKNFIKDKEKKLNFCSLENNNINNVNIININNISKDEKLLYYHQSSKNHEKYSNKEISKEKKIDDYYTSPKRSSNKLEKEKQKQQKILDKKINKFDEAFKPHSEYISEDIFNKMNEPIIDKIENNVLKYMKKNETKNDNLLERPPIKFISNNCIYKGTWNMKTFKKEGYGILFDENGNKYIGEFKNDKFEGKGLLISINGDYFIGNWKNGVMDGKGIFYSNEKKFKYEGNFADNKFNGNGKIIYDDKSYIFDGKFVDGLKEGKGKLIFENGSYYNGDFKEDYYWGEGEFCFENGRKYKGNWEKNEMSGKGTFIWDKDTKYEGEYKNNEKNGEGIYYFGKKYYSGKWVNNMPHDKGKIYIDSNNIIEAIFRYGKIISIHRRKSISKNQKSPKKKTKSNGKIENKGKLREIDSIPGIARKIHSKTIRELNNNNGSINN